MNDIEKGSSSFLGPELVGKQDEPAQSPYCVITMDRVRNGVSLKEKRIAHHLEGCEKCRTEVRDYQSGSTN